MEIKTIIEFPTLKHTHRHTYAYTAMSIKINHHTHPKVTHRLWKEQKQLLYYFITHYFRISLTFHSFSFCDRVHKINNLNVT